MKKTLFAVILFSVAAAGCNGGGNVPAYTTESAPAATSQTAPATASNTTVLAPTGAGRELFQAKCATCHGLDGNARNNNAANLQFTRLDSLSITQTILNGKGAMPPFRGAIADSQLAQLAIYVKSLRKG